MFEILERPAMVAKDELTALAAEINKEHEAGERVVKKGLEHYRNAGELLIKVKERVGHGHFRKWLKDNVKFNTKSASKYMKIARSWDLVKDCESMSEALGQMCTDTHFVNNGDDAPQDADDEAPEVNWIDKTCESVEWYTPVGIVDRVRVYFGGTIPLDPASPSHNPTGARKHFTEDDDGLTKCWEGDGVFLNPPYGEVMSAWMAKVHEEAGKGTPIVALLPCGARFSTGYWQDFVLSEYLRAVCFVRGRVAFVNEHGEPQKGNPYDSAIYGFNVTPDGFETAFKGLGKVLTISGVR